MKRLSAVFNIVFYLFMLALSACTTTTQIPPIKENDLIGEWIADYARYKHVAIHNAKEVVILHVDGTFTQKLSTKWGHQEENSGQWRAEKVSEYWSRVYLEGAAYYLYGFEVAHDPTIKLGAWDDVRGHEVTIEGGRTTVILYATRLLSKSESLCRRDYELVLQHLPIGDLDAPEYVTFHHPCSEGE